MTAYRGADGILHDGTMTIHHRSIRKLWVFDRLPMPRVLLIGRRWKRAFGVREVVIPGPLAKGRKGLVWSFEDDVRELVTKGAAQPEEIRPGVFAEWS